MESSIGGASVWLFGLLMGGIFVIVVWNLISPLEGERSGEFLVYTKYMLINWIDKSDIIQQYVKTPAASTINFLRESLTKNSTTGNSYLGSVGQEDAIVAKKPSPSTNTTSIVTLTFYIDNGNSKPLPNLLDTLKQYGIQKAVFFITEKYMSDHTFMLKIIKDNGYIIRPWTGHAFDRAYLPSNFTGIQLADKELLKIANKDAQMANFLDTALHSRATSIVAFTPKVMSHPRILTEILQENGKGLRFTDYDLSHLVGAKL